MQFGLRDIFVAVAMAGVVLWLWRLSLRDPTYEYAGLGGTICFGTIVGRRLAAVRSATSKCLAGVLGACAFGVIAWFSVIGSLLLFYPTGTLTSAAQVLLVVLVSLLPAAAIASGYHCVLAFWPKLRATFVRLLP